MVKVAVVFADGAEEIEGLTSVDVLRRLNVECDMVGLDKKAITGGHNIPLECSKVVDDSLLDYDMVVFPGGLKGAENLRDSATLKDLMLKRHQLGKWNAAMCAAPIAFSRYGLLTDTNYTCYPGFETEISQESPSSHFSTDITVTDQEQKIITSRGPATALAFAYQIAETLGIDTAGLQEGMLYDYLKENIDK
ncbi:DJ-1/PfpI family protein [Lactobacillus sp. PV037]|uniref:DJ-1 family glyoxalase III n=1 Tax=unclassified Lactobacillus TaxID=2620435 RepID=UPI0022407C95|nr:MULTISPECIES: DJ-1 family glyoxalase III [unclassified Lactobacillus]QNQ81849.1 DJ-1/PfpI family protein [Lactobacillus sp. PV012]QNQ84112.1 DJ-1/PfpI family protein [Lactobacillus sp. PV037]